MELDVYVEDLKLAFEYQGEQHYRPVHGMGVDFETQKTRDKEKKQACEQVQLISASVNVQFCLVFHCWIHLTCGVEWSHID